eukprot:1844693-Prymnesium_polylepis.1
MSSGVRRAEALITVSVDMLNRVNVALRMACTTESLMGRPVPLRSASTASSRTADWRLRSRPTVLLLLELTPMSNCT